uniref:Uncharacterized protein n=1 Tax=Kryptolebias marmoratus TaxID=37003 RepID=A0A3Q2ZE17_KRYMA
MYAEKISVLLTPFLSEHPGSTSDPDLLNLLILKPVYIHALLTGSLGFGYACCLPGSLPCLALHFGFICCLFFAATPAFCFVYILFY